MTTLYVDNIAPNLQSKISAPNLTLPTGSVISVHTSDFTGAATQSSSSWTDIPNLTLTFTPASATSKIYITGHVSIGARFDTMCGIRIIAAGNNISTIGDAAGSRTRGHTGLGYWNIQNNYEILAVPINAVHTLSSASSTIVKLQAINSDTSGHAFGINKSAANDPDATWQGRFTSNLTVMEIAG